MTEVATREDDVVVDERLPDLPTAITTLARHLEQASSGMDVIKIELEANQTSARWSSARTGTRQRRLSAMMAEIIMRFADLVVACPVSKPAAQARPRRPGSVRRGTGAAGISQDKARYLVENVR